MYWIFITMFIITVLIPDIIREGYFGLSETRVEEIFIFFMGIIAFIIFIKKEQKLIFHKKEKEKDQKKIKQTVKDLVESYSYIGEVNRKMDILMNIALGLSDNSSFNKNQENEAYHSITSATKFLLKSDYASLRFVDIKTQKTKKEIRSKESGNFIKNDILTKMEKNINIKKHGDCLIISSNQEIRGVKSYLLIFGFDQEEERNPKNLEILKVFASQALFIYYYIHNENSKKCPERRS